MQRAIRAPDSRLVLAQLVCTGSLSIRGVVQKRRVRATKPSVPCELLGTRWQWWQCCAADWKEQVCLWPSFRTYTPGELKRLLLFLPNLSPRLQRACIQMEETVWERAVLVLSYRNALAMVRSISVCMNVCHAVCILQTLVKCIEVHRELANCTPTTSQVPHQPLERTCSCFSGRPSNTIGEYNHLNCNSGPQDHTTSILHLPW